MFPPFIHGGLSRRLGLLPCDGRNPVEIAVEAQEHLRLTPFNLSDNQRIHKIEVGCSIQIQSAYVGPFLGEPYPAQAEEVGQFVTNLRSWKVVERFRGEHVHHLGHDCFGE